MCAHNTLAQISKNERWIIKAISRIKNWSEMETQKKWESLSDEKKKELSKNERVKCHIQIIKGEEAKKELDVLANSSVSQSKAKQDTRSDVRFAQILIEAMQWSYPATLQALSHLNEEEKVRLTTSSAKILLTRLSRALKMDKYPGKCSARDIANLFDEVLGCQTDYEYK